jgi:hypothetical protein
MQLEHESRAISVAHPNLNPENGVSISYDVCHEALHALRAGSRMKSSASSLYQYDEQHSHFHNAENNSLHQCRVKLSEDLGI